MIWESSAMAERKGKPMDMDGAEMMPVTETCPHCRGDVELIARRPGRGMLKAHLDELGIVCEGSGSLSVELRREL
jgi:hypothetical protein